MHTQSIGLRYRSRPVTCGVGSAISLVACGLAVNATAWGGAAGDSVLHLRTGDVAPAADSSALHSPAFAAGVRYVLGLDGPLSPERRARLATAGVKIEDYLGDNFILAEVSHATPASVSATGIVTWAGAYQNSWKIDPELSAGAARPRAARPFVDANRQAIEARSERVVSVYLFDGEALNAALDALRAIPGTVVLDIDKVEHTQSVVISIPLASIGRLANMAAARFVEEFQEFTGRDSSANWVVQSNVPNFSPFYEQGINGTGQVLGIIDSQIDTNHCAFTDPAHPIGPTHRKILAYNTTLAATAHGTHVAGIAVGDTGLFNEQRGIVYGAKIVYNTYPQSNESSFVSRYTLHNSQGAFVHSNSWGTEATTAYDGSCRGIDSFSWNNDDNLLVFAVSNGTVIKNPENAKDCLAVSASGDAPSQESFCFGGAGPTSDGRRKPEIMGPGCGIFAAASGTTCGIQALSGTSMATPTVAAAGVLLREYFTDGFYPSGFATPADSFVPTGALLKAALVNSAVDVTGIAGFPGLNEGWGRVLADNVAYFGGDARHLIIHEARNNKPGALSTGGAVVLRVKVGASAQSLKVTMAYHDAPAAINAVNATVNDLDLKVVAPSGVSYLGNDFANGESTTGGSPDAKNNLEQVLVSVPTPGIYSVVVAATGVNAGTQGYGLVVTGDVAELCPADFDGDGFVTGDDYDFYVVAFENGDVAADLNGDGFVTGDDFDAYTNAFEAGC